jgi:hypothetical protein
MTAGVRAGLAPALLILSIALSVQAQEPAAEPAPQPEADVKALEQRSEDAFAGGDAEAALEANRRLHELRPYEARYMYDYVRAAALLDRKTEAYEMMLNMQRQGLTADFNATEDTRNIRRTELYGYLNDVLIEAGNPAGEAARAFVLERPAADVGAIAWDPSRERFLVGTVAKGQVLAIAADGADEVLIEANRDNGLWSVKGLAVDAGRKRLWVSSSATPAFEAFLPTHANQGGLFEFDLETLQMVGRYLLPIDRVAHELGSLALTDDGHVYVIDQANPIVYRKRPDGDRLEAFVASTDLESLSDIAVAPDHSRLFVADRVMGVFVVDPIAEQAGMLVGPENLNLGGIEGVEYDAGRLIIVQGGLAPQRLMRLGLTGNGIGVEAVAPMAVSIDGFERPGFGTLHAGKVWYLANGGAADPAAQALVMSTSVEAGNDIVPPDMRRFRKSLDEKQHKDKDG